MLKYRVTLAQVISGSYLLTVHGNNEKSVPLCKFRFFINRTAAGCVSWRHHRLEPAGIVYVHK